MVLWWIGNAVLLFVVLPVVIALLNRVLAAVERIRAAADDILVHGVELTANWTMSPNCSRRPTPPSSRSRSAPRGTRAASRRCSRRSREDETMPAVAWVTIVIAALIIAVTAVGLLRVILHLRHVHFTLGPLRASAPAVPEGPGEQHPHGARRLGAVGERDATCAPAAGHGPSHEVPT